MQSHRNWRGHDDVMQTRSFRGSGEPARVNASSNARFGLGPDPPRALGPAAMRAASTGRTHDRTRPMLHQRKKALVNQAPSTHDPKLTPAAHAITGRMPIGNQSDAIVKTCRSKRAYSFLICTRTLSNSALAA